jgi:hypothetical protein
MASWSGSRPPRAPPRHRPHPAPPPDLRRLDIDGRRLETTLLAGPTCK